MRILKGTWANLILNLDRRAFNIRIHKYCISFEYDCTGGLSSDKHTPSFYFQLRYFMSCIFKATPAPRGWMSPLRRLGSISAGFYDFMKISIILFTALYFRVNIAQTSDSLNPSGSSSGHISIYSINMVQDLMCTARRFLTVNYKG